MDKFLIRTERKMDPLSLDCSSDAEICRTIAAVESEDGKLVCRSPSKKRKSSSFEALESSASSIESPQALVPPTKPLSAIFTWMSQERSACKAENPDASPEEISAIMRAQWSGMSSRDKLVFVQQFNAAKVKYEKERALYEKNLEAHTASIRNTGVEIVPSNIIKGTIENIPVQRARDPVFERASKLSKTDAKMVSKRRLRDRGDLRIRDDRRLPEAGGREPLPASRPARSADRAAQPRLSHDRAGGRPDRRARRGLVASKRERL